MRHRPWQPDTFMSRSNDAQIDYWNGRAGEKWAALQVRLDQMLSPATEALKVRAGSVGGKRVLDIGCGTGETCAVWLQGGAEVTGVDVSAPMLAVAAKVTEGKATLHQADASVWMGTTPFDLAVSRFGVMFFDDSESAFATIATNLRPGGRLLFACWRAAAENQWASAPMAAILDLLPSAPAQVLHAPGPFALADRSRLKGILEHAGFVDIKIDPFDFPVCLAREGGLANAVPFVMQMGPAGAALADLGPDVRAAAAARLNTALTPHDSNGLVTLGGAIWLVEAKRQG